MRRRFVSAMCILSMGSTAVHGQQANPFAEWDELQKKTSAAEVQQKPETGSAAARRSATVRPGGIQYFAPSKDAADTRIQTGEAVETTIAKDKRTVREESQPVSASEATARPLMVERLKSRSATQQPPASATTKDAAPASSGGAVTTASFDSSTAGSSGVQQVSGERQQSGASDNTNPFAELLKGATAEENPFSVGEPAFDLPMPQQASTAKPASTMTAFESKSVSSTDSGVQSPGVTMQWIRHGEFNVGQAGEVELQVQNTSRSMVSGVTAEVVIPEGLSVNSVSPQPTAGASSPTWTLGELKAGEKRSIMFNVTPSQRGEVRMDAFVRLTGYSSSSFAVREPMLAVVVDGPANVEVGQQISYTVRVNNPGTGVAGNVLIQAAIPEGLEHRRGSLLTIEIGTLNPGESRQAQLIVTAVRGGEHDMAVRVIADGGLLDQTVSEVTIEEPRLNLQITGPAEQMAGRTGDYMLQVVNEGGVPSANVRAKYRVPDGFEYVSADRGGKFNEVDRSIEWFVGTVGSGGSSQFRVVLKATETGSALHQAGVISEHGKVTMAEHATRVDGTAVLEMKVAASQSQINVGDEVTYEIRISNTGSRAAENVGVSCELPSALELLSVAGPSEYIAENGVMVFKSLPQVEVGKSAVFAIRLRSNRDGNHRIRLRVASESITEALIGEETASVIAR